MPLIPSMLPAGQAFPGNPQDLLNLFADHLTPAPAKKAFYSQDSSADIPTDGTALWYDTANGELKLYFNGQWRLASLPDGVITGGVIADNTITGDKIADGAITRSNFDPDFLAHPLPDYSVTNAKLADNAITTSKIADGVITPSKIAANGIPGSKLADGGVNGYHIVTGSIPTTKLAPNSISLKNLGASARAVLIPVGAVVWWAGKPSAQIPTGWLLCDGTQYYKTDYPVLAGVIGITTITENNVTLGVFHTPSDISSYGNSKPIIKHDYPTSY
jgi:hypothetical protein